MSIHLRTPTGDTMSDLHVPPARELLTDAAAQSLDALQLADRIANGKLTRRGRRHALETIAARGEAARTLAALAQARALVEIADSVSSVITPADSAFAPGSVRTASLVEVYGAVGVTQA